MGGRGVHPHLEARGGHVEDLSKGEHDPPVPARKHPLLLFIIILRYGNPDLLFLGTLKNKFQIMIFLTINMKNLILFF